MLFCRRSLWLLLLFPLSCGPTSDWPSSSDSKNDEDGPPRGADGGSAGSAMDAAVSTGDGSSPTPVCGADAGDAGDAGCGQARDQ